MPQRSTRSSTKNEEVREHPKESMYFMEEPYINRTRPHRRTHWRNIATPECIQVPSILAILRTPKEITSELQTCDEEAKLVAVPMEDIETVRKDNVFSEDITETDMDIIHKRVALQQRQFQDFERREKMRKSAKILAVFDYVFAEEIDEMLLENGNDEDEVLAQMLQNSTYIYSIRRNIANKHSIDWTKRPTILLSDEQKAAYQQLLKKRSQTVKKTTSDQVKKHYRMGGRLTLDDALKQLQTPTTDPAKMFEGWSQARIRAYEMIDKNPNSYYYRFNAPGEVQRKGQWDDDEKKLFFDRLTELNGANGQWGIFAMKVPGRVGYQCSNFYRLLIETKQLEDKNYYLDEKGKAHYLFEKKNEKGEVVGTIVRTHSKHIVGGGPSSSLDRSSRSSRSSSSNVHSRKRRKQRRDRWGSADDDNENISDFDDDDSGSYTIKSWSSAKRSRSRMIMAESADNNNHSSDRGSVSGDASGDEDQEKLRADNPLPTFLDPITLDIVVKPAISKYNHVMGYDSWIRCLTNWEGKSNICPLTKQPLKRRDLTLLTWENIEQYRYKIVNL